MVEPSIVHSFPAGYADVHELSDIHAEDLRRAISEVRRRARALLHWHGLFVAAALGLTYVLAGLILAHIFPQFAHLRYLWWAGLVLIPTAVYWFAGLRPRGRYRSDEQVALLIQRELPELEDAPVNAVQFREQLERGTSYSTELIEAYLRRAGHITRGLCSRVSVSEVPVVRSMGAVVGAAVLFFGGVLLIPGVLGSGLHNLTRPPKRLSGGRPDRTKLRIADLRVTYVYPDYLGREPRSVSGTDGSLRAVKGTQVRLEGRLEGVQAAATLFINGEEGRRLEMGRDGSFRVSFPLLESGSYHIATGPEEWQRTGKRSIELEPDRTPEVKISGLAPRADEDGVLRVEGSDAVQIAYRCRDDHGLGTVFLEYRRDGRTRREQIHVPGPDTRSDRGVYEWVLPISDAGGAADLTFRVGAADNDNISGPKIGYSRRVTVRPITDEMRHGRLLARQEQLQRYMVELLAEELTAPFSRTGETSEGQKATAAERLISTVHSVTNLTDAVVSIMRTDPLSDESFEEALQEMHRRRRSELDRFRSALPAKGETRAPDAWQPLGQEVEQAVPDLEEDILRLDELLQMDHMRAVRRMAERLKKMQQGLKQLLEKAREGELSEEQMAALKDRIAAMKRMMRRLSRQMAKTARRIEREFLNPDALRTAEDREKFEEKLDRLQKMAESGKLDGALAEAEALSQKLDRMMSSLGKAGQRLARSRLGPQMAKMQQMQQGLQEVRNRQAELEKQTRELRERIRRSARKEHGNTLERFFEKQIARTEQLREELQGLNSRLEEEPGVEKYRRLRRELHETLRRLPTTEHGQLSADDNGHSAEAIQQKLEDLYRRISAKSRAAAAEQVMDDMPEAGNQTSELKQTLEDKKVEEALRRASSLTPRLRSWTRLLREGQMPDPAVGRAARSAATAEQIRSDLAQLNQTLKQAAQQKAHGTMGKPAEKTGQQQRSAAQGLNELMQKVGNAGGESLRRTLEGAESEMQSAAGRLSQRRLGPANENQNNALQQLDRAIAESEKAMKRMKQNMRGRAARPAGPRRREGRFGTGSDRVRIPDPSSYQVPEQFREAIEDALREGLPDSYRESNEDYYEELVK